jgi:SagB-type dehydrogenase family enzyme
MLLMTGVSAAPETLPPPERRGPLSLEEAIRARRSVREFGPAEISPRELSQLLWAAQGVTGDGGLRAAPSAGALYPLEVYVVLPSGCFHYDPARHRLVRRATRDLRSALESAALGQRPIADAPAVFVIAAVEARTRRKYGARTERYVAMEAGHAAQNLLLQAVALGLGGVPIGAFDNGRVARALALPAGERPLYLLPVGHPR